MKTLIYDLFPSVVQIIWQSNARHCTRKILIIFFIYLQFLYNIYIFIIWFLVNLFNTIFYLKKFHTLQKCQIIVLIFIPPVGHQRTTTPQCPYQRTATAPMDMTQSRAWAKRRCTLCLKCIRATCYAMLQSLWKTKLYWMCTERFCVHVVSISGIRNHSTVIVNMFVFNLCFTFIELPP